MMLIISGEVTVPAVSSSGRWDYDTRQQVRAAPAAGQRVFLRYQIGDTLYCQAFDDSGGTITLPPNATVLGAAVLTATSGNAITYNIGAQAWG